jgi:hypothetical protein
MLGVVPSPLKFALLYYFTTEQFLITVNDTCTILQFLINTNKKRIRGGSVKMNN